MVTGAGGSIGSELCLQILALNPVGVVHCHSVISPARISRVTCVTFTQRARSAIRWSGGVILVVGVVL